MMADSFTYCHGRHESRPASGRALRSVPLGLHPARQGSALLRHQTSPDEPVFGSVINRLTCAFPALPSPFGSRGRCDALGMRGWHALGLDAFGPPVRLSGNGRPPRLPNNVPSASGQPTRLPHMEKSIKRPSSVHPSPQLALGGLFRVCKSNVPKPIPLDRGHHSDPTAAGGQPDSVLWVTPGLAQSGTVCTYRCTEKE